MWPSPRCGERLREADRDGVGLAELLAQRVAQRGLEHVVAALTCSWSTGSDDGSAKKLITVWLRGSRPFSTRSR